MAYGGRSGRPWAGAGDVELWLLAASLRRRPWRRGTHHQCQFPVARDCRGDAARIQARELRLRSAGSAGPRSDKRAAGRLCLSRHCAAPAGGCHSAGECRCGAPAQCMDGLVDQRSGQRSALVSEMEDHAGAAAAERNRCGQHPDGALGGDGNHRRCDADRLHQRGQPAAGPRRCAPAGACGPLGAGRGTMADCAGTSAGERDAGPAGRSGRAWRWRTRDCAC